LLFLIISTQNLLSKKKICYLLSLCSKQRRPPLPF